MEISILDHFYFADNYCPTSIIYPNHFQNNFFSSLISTNYEIIIPGKTVVVSPPSGVMDDFLKSIT